MLIHVLSNKFRPKFVDLYPKPKYNFYRYQLIFLKLLANIQKYWMKIFGPCLDQIISANWNLDLRSCLSEPTCLCILRFYVMDPVFWLWQSSTTSEYLLLWERKWVMSFEAHVWLGFFGWAATWTNPDITMHDFSLSHGLYILLCIRTYTM